MLDIYCVGDSITRGGSDAEAGGWVTRLKSECSTQGTRVINLGIGGETTRKMRLRLLPDLKKRLRPDFRSFLTLGYGANDAAGTAGEFLVPVSEYVENLDWAIDQARQLGCDVLLLNITPLAPAADNVPSYSGRVRSNAAVSLYNQALLDLAHRKKVDLIDVNSEFKKYELSTLFVEDGLHPNAQGHALIYNLVREYLAQLNQSEV